MPYRNDPVRDPHPNFRSPGKDMIWILLFLMLINSVISDVVTFDNRQQIFHNREVGIQNRVVTCMSLKLHNFPMPSLCLEPEVVSKLPPGVTFP